MANKQIKKKKCNLEKGYILYVLKHGNGKRRTEEVETFSFGEKCMEIKLAKNKIVDNGVTKYKILRS